MARRKAYTAGRAAAVAGLVGRDRAIAAWLWLLGLGDAPPHVIASVYACEAVFEDRLGVLFNRRVNVLGDVVLSDEEKCLFAFGTRFIPSMTPDGIRLRESVLEAWDRFVRRVRLFHHHRGKERPPFDTTTTVSTMTSVAAWFRRPNPSFQPRAAPFGIEQIMKAIRGRIGAEVAKQAQVRFPVNLPAYLRKTLRRIRERKDLVIRPADKNLGTTVMTREWYMAAAYVHVNDVRSYKLVGEATPDITQAVLDHIYDELATLGPLMRQAFEKDAAEYITGGEANATLPRLYVIPKLHKISARNPYASRPIAANVNAPTTVAARLLSKILQPLVLADTHILKDTLSLVRDLQCGENLGNITAGDVLLTIDVEALYPSVDREIVINLARDLFKSSYPGGVLADALTGLLRVVLEQVFVTFDNKIYEMTDGIAMGVACCTWLGNLYVLKMTENICKQAAELGWIRDYRVYIDDILVIWCGPEDQIQHFMDALNSVHPKLKFTYNTSKTEAQFLDLVLFKGPRLQQGRLDHRIYVKELNAWLYIPLASAHPAHSLKHFIRAEAVRFVRNSTRQCDAAATTQSFVKHLLARGYPWDIVRDELARVKYTDRDKYVFQVKEAATSKLVPLVIEHNNVTAQLGIGRLVNPVIKELFSPNHKLVIAWKKAKDLNALMRRQWPAEVQVQQDNAGAEGEEAGV